MPTTKARGLGAPIEYENMPAIYILRNRINGKFYIGETLNLKRRMYSYHAPLVDRPIKAALIKYGIYNFDFEYYYLPNHSKKDLLELEEQLIKRYGSLTTIGGYNVCSGGQDMTGLKQSKETCAKRNASLKGRVFTPEWKRRISESKKGKPRAKHSEETKRKMGLARRGSKNCNYGKKMSDETKRKIAENHPFTKPILQYTKDGECVGEFLSIKEAARRTGSKYQNISAVLQGRGKTCGGYFWKYSPTN